MEKKPLVEVINLKKYYPVNKGIKDIFTKKILILRQ